MMKVIHILLLASLINFTDPAIVRCLEKEADSDAAPDRKLPQLKPGQWEPLFEMGENIYPSVIISTATFKEGLWNDECHLGDPWGMIGIAVRGTGDNCPVEVEISGSKFAKPSKFTGTLPDKNKVYCVYPDLKYDYDGLAAVKQTIPDTISFKVKVGSVTYPEKSVRIQVRPVNECVFTFVDSSGNVNDVSQFFAAYVNENHPFINQILKEAIESDRVDSFSGYQGDGDEGKESVMSEIKAVWVTLQERGIRYSGMPASADDDNPYLESQYVRLLGESINYTQANCVDGSVLMASIFRKMGLNASLVAIPGHMFVGVSLDQEGKDMIYIETTDLGQSSFEEALDDGKEEFAKGRGKFDSEKEEDQEYHIINIQDARVAGIIPIKDSSAQQIVSKGNHPTRIKEEDDE